MFRRYFPWLSANAGGWGFFLLVLPLLVIIGVATVLTVSPASTKSPLCSDSPGQIEEARRLVHQGLDEALQAQIGLLFKNWMSSVEEPERAANGVRNAMRAWFHANEEVDALAIPPCKK